MCFLGLLCVEFPIEIPAYLSACLSIRVITLLMTNDDLNESWCVSVCFYLNDNHSVETTASINDDILIR